MTAPAELAALNLPWAARLQGDVLELDLELAERARDRRPGVRWWWGQRVTAGANGALCYLCNESIATWYRARPVTRGAVEKILTHRWTHAPDGYVHHGTTAGGKSPAADAPPPEGQE